MCAWADLACGTPPSTLLVPDVQQDERYVNAILNVLLISETPPLMGLQY